MDNMTKTLSGILSSRAGQYVVFKAVVSDVTVKAGANGDYLSITLCDKNERVTTPFFGKDDIAKLKSLQVGKAYMCKATINIWNEQTQFKNLDYRELSEDEFEAKDFISSYEIPEIVMQQFISTINCMKEPYKTIAEKALGRKGGDMWHKFITCPSAEKHHGNRLGGLFLHEFGVLMNVASIMKTYATLPMYGDIYEAVNKDRLILKAIIHDIMKIEEYDYSTFIRRKPGVVGHLYDGVSYIVQVNKECGNILSADDLENIKTSILTHHGEYGPMKPTTLEDTIIHLADMIDARVVGELESNSRKK